MPRTTAVELVATHIVPESLRVRSAALLASALSAVAGVTELAHLHWLSHPHHTRSADTVLAAALILLLLSFGLAKRIRLAAILAGSIAILSFAFHVEHGDAARVWGWEVALLLVLVTFRNAFDLPRAWELSVLGSDLRHAANIAAAFGSGAQDFFKVYGDKSLFFGSTGNSFVSYRVAHRMAVALGDPVGPPVDAQETFREFAAFAISSGWRFAFHQASESWRRMSAAAGFRSLCIGEDAIVDLSTFGLQGKRMKEFRNTVTRVDKLGCRVERVEAPLPPALVAELAEVSDEWLRLPGRRERRFTLGMFTPEYVAGTPVYVARDADGRVLAFLNLPPTWSEAEAAVDLMRRRDGAPNGIIDYLFTKTFLDLKSRGCLRVNLGMAPLCGLQVREGANWEERLVYAVFRYFDRVFSFRGLRSFKAKYATHWEPRYAVYSSPADLPRLGLALRDVTEIEDA